MSGLRCISIATFTDDIYPGDWITYDEKFGVVEYDPEFEDSLKCNQRSVREIITRSLGPVNIIER